MGMDDKTNHRFRCYYFFVKVEHQVADSVGFPEQWNFNRQGLLMFVICFAYISSFVYDLLVPFYFQLLNVYLPRFLISKTGWLASYLILWGSTIGCHLIGGPAPNLRLVSDFLFHNPFVLFQIIVVLLEFLLNTIFVLCQVGRLPNR